MHTSWFLPGECFFIDKMPVKIIFLLFSLALVLKTGVVSANDYYEFQRF